MLIVELKLCFLLKISFNFDFFGLKSIDILYLFYI
jgi:hypothetical protein